MAVIEDEIDHDSDSVAHASNGVQSDSEAIAAKPGRKAKAKTDQQSDGNFSIGDIKRATAFANSIGGLDKAIAVLQILKVAKEVQ
jgi:hypothetical protein